MDKITGNKAKKIIADKLETLGLPQYKLTAKTIDFTDLARASKLFVKINGWKPSPLWSDLQETAKANGFLIQD
jgi:hypothetical protein